MRSRDLGSGVLVLALAMAAERAEARLPLHFLPGDAAVASAAGDQSAVALAPGGDLVLAVWSDNRANSTGGYEGETSRDLYALRLGPDGLPLEAVPFAITAEPASQDLPKAAWNGTSWLVVFESYDLGGTGYYYQKSLQAVRVAPDGQVLDPRPIKLWDITPSAGWWAVASDGDGWAIAAQGTSSGGDIVALRVSAGGELLDQPPRLLVPATYYMRSNLHLAFAGGVYLMTYDEMATGSSSTSALRFDPDLDPLDAAPSTLLPVPLLGLASNGAAFYAAWNQQQPNYTMAVIGSRIDTNGQKLDGTGVKISGTHSPDAYTTTSVAWDGTSWKVTWGSGGSLWLARVNSAGQVLNPGGISVAGPLTGPTASWGDGALAVAWTAYVGGENNVLAARIGDDNLADPNRALSIGTPQQRYVDVAASGSGYMVVYRSSTADQSRILAQPLDAAGNPLTAEPTLLDAGGTTGGPGAPAVAWNGSVYLATWANASGVVARRLQADGTPVDVAPFVVLNPGFGPAEVEALGDLFLVVGLRCGYTCQIVFPIAARVRGTDGVVLDTPPIAMGGTFCSSPRATVLGGRWLVAWQNNASHDNPMASTLGAFIDASGGKAPDFTIHGSFSTSGGNGIFSLGLASSGSVALLVQSQELSSGVETDLLARRVLPDGTVLPYVNLTPWAGNQYRPRAAWDGQNFVVVFQDQKARFTYWSLEQLDARSDLFGMRIAPTGAIVDTQGFLFSNSATGEAQPSVVARDGVTLIAGSVVLNDLTHANYRIGYELFGVGGNHWPVAQISAAPSGGAVPLVVGFSSAGSGDPDGALASYLWDFGDGAISLEHDPTHAYTVGGPYVATLTVTDSGGAQATQEMAIAAVEPNEPPVAQASSDVSSGVVPFDVVLFAAGSYDPDGFIGNVHWTFSDGGEYWGTTAYHTFYEPGTHTVTLTVFDSFGATGTDTLTIYASDGTNLPPVAVASASISVGAEPLAVSFSSAGSMDPDGTITAYAWSFGDGGSSTLPNPVHTYQSTGSFTATLVVTDNLGATGAASVAILSCDESLVPGEVSGLKLRHKSGVTSLNWNVALAPGGLTVTYDVLASDVPEFAVAECLEADGSDTKAFDAVDPAPGAMRCYLVRAGNACGEGSWGTDSSGAPRQVSACP